MNDIQNYGPPYKSVVIANHMLDIAKKRGLKLTIVKLLKLVYMAHGWWLTFNEKPLTVDNPEAWRHGPVYPEVYEAFRGDRRDRGKRIQSKEEYKSKIDKDTEAMLEAVLNSYGEFKAFQLSNMTHRPGTPWQQVIEKNGRFAPIPSDIIKGHFDELREKAEG